MWVDIFCIVIFFYAKRTGPSSQPNARSRRMKKKLPFFPMMISASLSPWLLYYSIVLWWYEGRVVINPSSSSIYTAKQSDYNLMSRSREREQFSLHKYAYVELGIMQKCSLQFSSSCWIGLEERIESQSVWLWLLYSEKRESQSKLKWDEGSSPFRWFKLGLDFWNNRAECSVAWIFIFCHLWNCPI